VLTGVRATTGGHVLIAGRDVTHHSPGARIAGGLGYIPEDRLRVGSVVGLSVRDNLMLKGYRQPPLSRGPLLRFKAMREHAQNLVEQFGVSTPGIDVTLSDLSGGNIQKVILAREMSAQPKVIVASHPTRGLDVGAAQAIHRRLIEQVETGAAVLLISEDIDELLALSNRIAVMYKGEIAGIVAAPQASLDEIGLMMAGGLRRPPVP
jgi:simple sugar transport system ATP-binding protein